MSYSWNLAINKFVSLVDTSDEHFTSITAQPHKDPSVLCPMLVNFTLTSEIRKMLDDSKTLFSQVLVDKALFGVLLQIEQVLIHCLTYAI